MNAWILIVSLVVTTHSPGSSDVGSGNYNVTDVSKFEVANIATEEQCKSAAKKFAGSGTVMQFGHGNWVNEYVETACIPQMLKPREVKSAQVP